jgi:hypothetical protein
VNGIGLGQGIGFLNQKSHQGKIVIILSGLKADMKWLMSTRPILLALFDEKLDFKNIPPQDCVSLLVRELEASNIIPEASFLKHQSSNDFKRVSRLFNVLEQLPDWCNARDIRQLPRQILGMLLEASASTSANNASPVQSLPSLIMEMVTRICLQTVYNGIIDDDAFAAV